MNRLEPKNAARIRRYARAAERHLFDIIEASSPDQPAYDWLQITYDLDLAIAELSIIRDTLADLRREVPNV